MNKQLVSVIIPTFNRASTIERAVLSVLGQTFREIELIVVDDASRDDTLERLAAIKDPRMRVLRHERNAGGSAARNTGLRAARGRWVAFQDSDDEWLLGKLERQLAALNAPEANGARAAYCSKIVVGRNSNLRFGQREACIMPPPGAERVEGDLFDAILHNALISTQTLIADRAILNEIGGFDERLKLGQDWDLTARLAQKTKIIFIDEPLVCTTIMPDSISSIKINQYETLNIILAKHAEHINKDRDLIFRFHYSMGDVKQRYKEYASARPHFQKAIAAKPTAWKAWAKWILGAFRADIKTSG